MKKIATLGILLLATPLCWGCKKNASSSPPASASTSSGSASSTAATARRPAPVRKKVDTSLPGDPVAGKAIYQKICLACHGADGSGNGGVTAANFLKEKHRLQKGNKALLHSIRNGVTNGSRVMPPQKGVLSEKQMKDVLSYLRKTFGKQGK